ncbi:caa(3)-type oxidase subunit IV [Dyella monticola]|uniref:Caa(3)-type oxidase subunit IV n=1 Tax=Dyella monticola TaxID=1927958 RepID=A0A370WXC1_9GAMM|nr:cytochrome C oxidase subunit IV family protein [Dyella monticola]RDS80798.1 caa(3)-type oxidase subunit IV [Dyella monticola]
MRQYDIPTLRSQLMVWAGLLILLAASASVSRLALGWWVLVITATVAMGQALLVLVVFMRLKRAHPALRMIAMLAFAWPVLMVVLTLGDYLTRSLLHSPM